MPLVDKNGNAISSSDYAKPKVKSKKSPKIGELITSFGEDAKGMPLLTATARNNLQWDTSRLVLSDYRLMRDHYQVNSSLSLLTFMLHQSQFTVECKNKKVADHCEMNLRRVWTRLVRALSQAFWAGYSPNALQWENDEHEGKVMLTKIKDLRPEQCSPRWKKVGGIGKVANDPDEIIDNAGNRISNNGKAKIFDGIKQIGYESIPVENSFWYSLIQENGNMYGKKLLNAAFQPWFFSLLIHMYSNRYFERFGEPVIIARAPYDDVVDVEGMGNIRGNDLMRRFTHMVRNGAAPVLPNSLQQTGISNGDKYEYDMEYLESQMRGADFERYLERLDQEISLALFTPVLMTSTGSGGGSFNLGLTHANSYYHQLNAILGDWKEYIDNYILQPMARYNFGDKVDRVEIKFRRLGGTDPETLRMVFSTLVSQNKVMPDLVEMGQELGLTLEEIEQVVEPPEPVDPNADSLDPDNPDSNTQDPNNKQPQKDTRQGRPERSPRPKGTDKKGKVSSGLAKRLEEQFISGKDIPDAGFKARYCDWFSGDVCGGFIDANIINSNYNNLTKEIENAYVSAKEVSLDSGVEQFFSNVVTRHLDRVESEYASQN